MTIIHGDCLRVMREMDLESVDSIVCDPPYGLSFMGQDWDHGIPGPPFWRAAIATAKPGAYLVAAGGTRTFHRLACAIEDAGWEMRDCLSWLYGSGWPKAKTCLKPAWEPWLLAKKPGKTLHLNVDACRIAAPAGDRTEYGIEPKGGRWPANVVLDEEAGAALDEQSGEIRTQRIEKPCPNPEIRGHRWGTMQGNRGARGYSDTGGASRFYYCAKASRKERGEENDHPTVKPISLMRWLCRLVTPPGGLILDPFTGSGSTGCAAVLEGFRFIGVEQDATYCDIARRRIKEWTPAA